MSRLNMTDSEFLLQESTKRMLTYLDARARAKGRDTSSEPPSTKRIFLLYLKLFCERVAERTPDELIKMRNDDLKNDQLRIKLRHEEMANQFIVFLSKHGKSSNTISTALSAVRTFYATNYVALSEKAVIVPSGQPEKMLWRPDISDIAKLVKKAREKDDERSAAYICCGKDCGVGIGDMLKIKWTTESLEFGTLKQQFKKGMCPIHIPFFTQGRQKTMVKFETFWGEDAINALNKFADFNQERIFKISDSQIRLDLAAIDPRIKPHTLRKVFTQTMKRSLSIVLSKTRQSDASGISDAIVEYWSGHSLGKVRAAYNIPPVKTQIEMYREAYPRIKLKVK